MICCLIMLMVFAWGKYWGLLKVQGEFCGETDLIYLFIFRFF